MQFPFIGGAYQGRVIKNNPQECINLIPVSDIASAKSTISLIGTPGLTKWANPDEDLGYDPGKVRALFYRTPYIYVVSGANLYRLTSTPLSSLLGSTTTYANLITNGDMELDSNWADTTLAPATNERSDALKHADTYSRKFITDGAFQGIQSDVFSTTAGKKYTLSFWIYPSSGANHTCGINIIKGDGSAGYGQAVYNLVTGAWNYVTYTWTESVGGAVAAIGITGYAAYPATYYVDDVTVRLVGAASGLTWLASNDSHLVGVEPGGSGWTYNYATTTFAAITDGDFPTPRGLCYLDGRFIVTKESTNKWYISALNDPTAWDALDFGAAESFPGILRCCIALKGQVALLGWNAVEFHAHTGAADWPFQRVAVVEEGIGAEGSLAKHNEAIYFLTNKRELIRVANYQVDKVSTESVDYHIQSYDTVDDAYGFIYSQEGHTFYQVNFPSADETWVFDITTGLFHKRQSYKITADDTYGRHRAISSVHYGQKVLMGDYENGNIYEASLNVFTDNGYLIRRRRTTPVIHNELKTIFFHTLEIDIDNSFEIVPIEYVTNGDMELDEEWTEIGDCFIFMQTDEEAHAGGYSWTFKYYDADCGMKSSSAISTKTRTTYKFSAWVFPVAVDTIRMYVMGGDGVTPLIDVVKTDLTANEWNYIEESAEETAGGDSAYVMLTGGDETFGEYFIDDVSLAGGIPSLVLDWSNDGGYTYGAEHTKYLNSLDYGYRAKWERLGSARNRVFRITTKSNSKIAFINADLKATPGNT